MPIQRPNQMRPIINQGSSTNYNQQDQYGQYGQYNNNNQYNNQYGQYIPNYSQYPPYTHPTSFNNSNMNHLNINQNQNPQLDDDFSFDESDTDIDQHFNHMNSTRQPQHYNNDRFQRAMLTPLPPPPPIPTNNDLNNAPLPPRHLYRRGAFNQELPSRSSTLSVNRDTGNVSYSTFTNNSIHLNNSVLRRVIQPQYNFNHHQQINPTFANSNESHTIRQTSPSDLNGNGGNNNGNQDNASTFNFLNDINRLSSQSLYNDLNGDQITEEGPNQNRQQRQLRNPLFHNHYDHSIPINLSRSNNINAKLNEFFHKRKHQGQLFDDYKLNHNPRKRHAVELNPNDDSTKEPFHEFQFPITRCCPCSFIKSGFAFNLKEPKPNEIPFNLSFISVNYDENKIRGVFQFEHLYLMNHWLSEISPNDNKVINISGNNNSFNFTGSIVDFENEDLRFNCKLLDQLHDDEFAINYPRMNDERFRNNKNMKLIYNDCIIKKQLQKWKFLKPFKNIKVKDLISILTCNECLTKLQENYMLMKIYIDGGNGNGNSNQLTEDPDDSQPILLCCVDRRTGELELISSEGRQKSIVEEYIGNINQMNNNGNRNGNNGNDDNGNLKYHNFQHDDEVIKMSMKCKKYVSPSLKFC